MSSLPSPSGSTRERRSSRGSTRSFRSAIAITPQSDGQDAVPLPEPAQPAHQERIFSGLHPFAGTPKRPSLSPTPSIKSSTKSLKSMKHSSLPINGSRPHPLPPRAVSSFEEGSAGGSAPSHPLSPIVEQDQLSPEAKLVSLPMNSIARQQMAAPSAAPDLADVPRTSPHFPTFITRSLNRSISQMSVSSSRTHKSVVSQVPSIPPLDLGEQFHSHLVTPPLPALQRASTTYTARTGSTLPYAYSGTCDETSSLHAESYLSGRATSPGSYTRPPLLRTERFDPYARAEEASARSTAPGAQSITETVIGRRWTQNLSFGSDMHLFAKAKAQKSSWASKRTPACLLFWVGFVAPWCWIIGGWLLTNSGQTRTDGQNGRFQMPSLPFWNSKKAGKGAGGDAGYGLGRGYPFVAPKVESHTSTTFMMKPPFVGALPVDPWVHRCRVAAVTAGIVLFIGFVVALVMVGIRR
ncbi:hypothetical protein HWV62_44786 [Athelia sp. TMB]|nr:hypothetical protein HWV62_44786 [Athelia sp. TMB]